MVSIVLCSSLIVVGNRRQIFHKNDVLLSKKDWVGFAWAARRQEEETGLLFSPFEHNHWFFSLLQFVSSHLSSLVSLCLILIIQSLSLSRSVLTGYSTSLSLSWTQGRTPSLRGVLFQELPFKCLCIFVALQNPISMSINQYIIALGLHSMKRDSLDILLG